MKPVCICCGVGLLLVAGCVPLGGERNAFWTMAEAYGAGAGAPSEEDAGGGGGAAAEGGFRRSITLTLRNNHSTADVETSFAAWVNVSSIRSADQQDALLSGGYVQLSREVRLGSAFTLPPGTFVYNGPGIAGATPVTLASPVTETADRSLTREFTLITPDVLLVFVQPPESCDNAAFIFGGTAVGAVTGPTTSGGGYKTYSQVDVYQCDPLRPGLFLKTGGGARERNEFYEGATILFEFNETADEEGNFATVTISS